MFMLVIKILHCMEESKHDTSYGLNLSEFIEVVRTEIIEQLHNIKNHKTNLPLPLKVQNIHIAENINELKLNYTETEEMMNDATKVITATQIRNRKQTVTATAEYMAKKNILWLLDMKSNRAHAAGTLKLFKCKPTFTLEQWYSLVQGTQSVRENKCYNDFESLIIQAYESPSNNILIKRIVSRLRAYIKDSNNVELAMSCITMVANSYQYYSSIVNIRMYKDLPSVTKLPTIIDTYTQWQIILYIITQYNKYLNINDVVAWNALQKEFTIIYLAISIAAKKFQMKYGYSKSAVDSNETEASAICNIYLVDTISSIQGVLLTMTYILALLELTQWTEFMLDYVLSAKCSKSSAYTASL